MRILFIFQLHIVHRRAQYCSPFWSPWQISWSYRLDTHCGDPFKLKWVRSSPNATGVNFSLLYFIFLPVRLVSSHRHVGIVIFLLMPRPNEIARHSLTYTIQYEITVTLQSYLSFSSGKWKRWQWRTDEISRARDTIDRARGSTMKSFGFQLSPCAALNISRLRSSRKSSQRR